MISVKKLLSKIIDKLDTQETRINTQQTRVGNRRFVTYTYTVTQLKDRWHSHEVTPEDVVNIFGTSDVTKIHIVALDEWLDPNRTDGSGGTWTTQPGYFENRWYMFPRYDMHPTSKRMEIISYDPFMTESSRQLTWRLLAVVED